MMKANPYLPQVDLSKLTKKELFKLLKENKEKMNYYIKEYNGVMSWQGFYDLRNAGYTIVDAINKRQAKSDWKHLGPWYNAKDKLEKLVDAYHKRGA